MPDTTELLSQFYIKMEGQPASELFMNHMTDATVETSLHLPDVATMTLHDPNGTWVDDSSLSPGATIEITAKLGTDEHKLFDGEVVELESDFLPGDRRVVIRAFDRLHRLARGRQVKSFVNVSDSDIITQVASAVGLQSQVGPASTVHPYVLQDNITNLEFLRERAAMLGYLLYVDGKTLHCEAHGKQTGTVSLEYGIDLTEFHPRLTTVDQIKTATAGGWDPKQRKEVLGTASSANGEPQLGSSKSGGQVAQDAFGFEAKVLVADRPIRDQAVADKVAQATLDRRAGRFVEAEGVAGGRPDLIAGVTVDLKALGTRFSGKYFVTASTHTYSAHSGYSTRFTVSGFQPSTLLSVLGPERDGLPQMRVGLVVGIVTDNNDPDGLGKVKVKFPWLSSEHASDWARVVTIGGGPQRGLEFLPEVNDEVLVGFEHGDINFPYVLGGLWNGQDAPPGDKSKVIASGKINQRIIRSRTGHIVTMDDSDDAPSITIVDNTGKNKINLDSKNNKLTVHLEGDMLFEATSGDISLKAKTFNVEASDALKLKGQTVDTQADTSFNIKAGTDLKLKGTNTEMDGDASIKLKGAQAQVQAQAQLSLDGGAMTEVKGILVKVGG